MNENQFNAMLAIIVPPIIEQITNCLLYTSPSPRDTR